jgi:hypothetical protein
MFEGADVKKVEVSLIEDRPRKASFYFTRNGKLDILDITF